MSELVDRLREIVGAANVVTGDAAVDFTHDATFLEHDLLVVARGSGTSLVGGSVPLGGGIVLSLDRMNGIEIDAPNTMAVAGPGAITAHIDAAAAEHGLMYPPDPASMDLCSIGGNVACNSGGMRCIKYGLTADYVVGLTVVLADGQVLKLGGRRRKRSSGYRLIQLFVGSEGTLGIVTEVILKLLPLPRHRATELGGFRRVEDAGQAVARVLGAGHFPACVELLDRDTMQLVHEGLPPGFEPDLDAALIIEQDGNDEEQVQLTLLQMVVLLDGVDNRIAQSSVERERLWQARRNFGKVLMSMPHNNFAEDVAGPIRQNPQM